MPFNVTEFFIGSKNYIPSLSQNSALPVGFVTTMAFHILSAVCPPKDDTLYEKFLLGSRSVIALGTGAFAMKQLWQSKSAADMYAYGASTLITLATCGVSVYQLYKRYNERLEKKNKKIAGLEDQIGKLKAQLQEAETAKKTQTNEIADLKKQLEGAKQTQQQSETEKSRLQKELQVAENAKNQLEAEAESLKNKMEQMEVASALSTSQMLSDSDIELQCSEIIKLKQKNKEFLDQIDFLSGYNQSLNLNKLQLEEEKNEEICDLEKQIEILKGELESEKQECEEVRQALEEALEDAKRNGDGYTSLKVAYDAHLKNFQNIQNLSDLKAQLQVTLKLLNDQKEKLAKAPDEKNEVEKEVWELLQQYLQQQEEYAQALSDELKWAAGAFKEKFGQEKSLDQADIEQVRKDWLEYVREKCWLGSFCDTLEEIPKLKQKLVQVETDLAKVDNRLNYIQIEEEMKPLVERKVALQEKLQFLQKALLDQAQLCGLYDGKIG